MSEPSNEPEVPVVPIEPEVPEVPPVPPTPEVKPPVVQELPKATPSPSEVDNSSVFSQLGTYGELPQVALAVNYFTSNGVTLSPEVVETALEGDFTELLKATEGVKGSEKDLYLSLLQQVYDTEVEKSERLAEQAREDVLSVFSNVEELETVLGYFEETEDGDVVDSLNDLLGQGGAVAKIIALGMHTVYDNNFANGLIVKKDPYEHKPSGTKTIAKNANSSKSDGKSTYERAYSELAGKLDRGEITYQQFMSEVTKL